MAISMYLHLKVIGSVNTRTIADNFRNCTVLLDTAICIIAEVEILIESPYLIFSCRYAYLCNTIISLYHTLENYFD